MPVVFQKLVRKEDLRRNPQVLYPFPDDARKLTGVGMAAHCRGEPNAVPVPVRWSPFESFGNSPASVLAQSRLLDEAFKKLTAQLLAGGIVIWPSIKFAPDMPAHAPRTYDYFRAKLRALFAVGGLFPPEVDQEDPE